MTVHVFNPEHDLALASNLTNFTAPRAGRMLRSDLGFIPALWAEAGDGVLVDDGEVAKRQLEALRNATGIHSDEPLWLTWADLAKADVATVEPWGWDGAVRHQLMAHGVSSAALPTADEIAVFRSLSHRRHAAETLRHVQSAGTTGVATMCQSNDEIDEKLNSGQPLVMKVPWSSSGRGVRIFDGDVSAGPAKVQNLRGWAAHVLHSQGCVMVEPYYNKVIDFGMEFVSDGLGGIDYLGLSVFYTDGSAYTGNLLATEQEKVQLVSRYITTELLQTTKAKLQSALGQLYKGRYRGPLGVDMMVVRADAPGREAHARPAYLLHPCVEINLRRTMGHVALALSARLPSLSPPRLMRISYDGAFRLQVAACSP